MMEWELDQEDGENEEGEEGVGEWSFGGRTATIFLIDAAKEMFNELDGQEEEEEATPFLCSIKAAHATLMRKVVSSDGDLVSVVLFNTRETSNPIDLPGIYVLQDMERPGAEKILGLEKLMSMNDANFNKDYGHTTSATIHDALRVCQSVFTNCKKRLSGQTVLMLTCRDDPHPGEVQQHRRAKNKARDLREAEVVLEILHLGTSFDINKFYKDLIIVEDDEDGNDETELSREGRTLADPVQRLGELMDRVRRLEHKQRTTGRVTFSLAPGVELSVGVYTTIRKMYKPSKVNLWKNTNEDVHFMKKEYLEETGELLMRSDYCKYQVYGGEKIKFSLDEVRNMSRVYDTGMELLGFKPITSIKPYFYTKPANFLYPDEKSIQGSTKLFAALLERCLVRKVAAIVRMMQRRGANASLTALIPQEEKLDNKKSQVFPPGFIAFHLPFADDRRNIQVANATRATADQVDAAKKVIKKLHFKYSPENFDNPDLQTHWENVKALALNRSQVDEVEDFTVPNYEMIEQKAGPLITEMKDLVFPQDYDPSKAIKRPAPPASTAPKKAKPDPSTIDVEAMAKAGKADKLTVDVLKGWLKSRGVHITGKKKAELVCDVIDQVGV
ncbi:hypothetical protein Pmani_005799 [Petrolisthes manimaculis]|uniref:ATP-dependent DNA helicase 2 subunit 1 n=1 Tax=Petrolisthes manimaculis TaxID=1843537 RepID=A0AAE1QAY6_9EUCA|nr:hypothetical protein Pmani_005799 [Petrolisthes manimaculis]